MPIPAYLKIQGEKTGDVTAGAMSEDSVGRLSKQSQIDTIQVQAMEGLIEMPKDEDTGQPSGRRRHKGITIHKIFDKSSPDLYGMLSSGERVSMEMDFFRNSPAGLDEKYFQIRIEGGVITGIRTYFPMALDPNFKQFHHMEAVNIAYRKITWQHLISNTMQTDDWDK